MPFLFLRKFHWVASCEAGRARFAEKKMEFTSQVVSRTYSILFSACFEPVFEPVPGPLTMYVWSEPLDDMACVVKRGTPPPPPPRGGENWGK